MKSARAVHVAIGIGLSVPCWAGGPLPIMSPDRPVQCERDAEGNVWRIQCDEHTHECLYAPNDELDSDGNRTKPIERARECAIGGPAFDRARFQAAGYTMRPGRADAPWGWTRDDHGRVFQIDFDLHRRLYLGFAYTPQKWLEDPLESQRTSIDFGLLVVDWLDGAHTDSPTRHRLRLVEGQVHMQPFSSEITLAHYDVSHRFADPLLRITTFVGPPQRHDLYLDLGMWSEVGGLELRHTALGDSQLWKHASAQVTLDLWQSADLESFVRLRTGVGLEGQHDDIHGYRSALTLSSALDADWILDDHGLQELRLELEHEVPRYFTPYDPTVFVQRMHARVQYEDVLLAINDQPVTLSLAAGGEKRNDIPGLPDRWAFVVDAGLRFSLWAPPRPRS